MNSKLTLTVFLFVLSFTSFAQQPFITTWVVFGPGGSPVGSIIFGAITTGPVSYSWETLPPSAPASGSGSFVGSNVTISGIPAGQRIRLTIQPENFRRIFNNIPDVLPSYAITEVNQWGSVEWISMEDAFTRPSNIFTSFNLVNATDIPNLTNVISMANMFAETPINTPFNINFWDVSNVTDMSGMFNNCTNFNQALSLWNTSNVTNMSSMFENASNFNQNIGNWNTSNVTSMNKMFKNANSFNRNIGNWNTINVTDMSEMFNGSFSDYAFNQNIGNWNVSSVTNMSSMFRNASNFNQNIGNWNVSNVTSMSRMFENARDFNQNIGNWNMSNVINMARMFSNDFSDTEYAFNNNGSSSIENWNTANVTDMSGMFFRAANFNQFLGNWILNPAVNLVEMLDRSGLDCSNYSQTIIAWNANPSTPNNKVLGATFMEYGPEAMPAINNLVFNKGWGFSGHDFLTVTPQFEIENNYCEGAIIPTLPDISEEGIPGSWSPELNSNQTTTYTFVPDVGQCATTSSVTITIIPFTLPSGESNQSFSTNSTLENIVISPSTILWYASLVDALANVNPINVTTPLEDGATYYAVNDNGACRSQPFPVTVSLNLSVDGNNFQSFQFYPNPVSSILTISTYNSIKHVEVYNLLGQLLKEELFANNSVSIDLSGLSKSIYVVKVKSEDAFMEFKIIKK